MNRKLFQVLLLPILLLASCNLPNSQTTPTGAADAVYTAAAQTVSAHLTVAVEQTAASASQTPSVTPIPSATMTPEVTPIPPATRTSAPLLPSATAQVCNRAEFVSDVSIPDGTQMEAGETFTKTWRLKNVGTCTWTTDYDAFFKGGNQMGAPAYVALPKAVAPGETVDISVKMITPSEAGDYTGFWKLRNADGAEFDSGLSKEKSFYVQIKVVTGIFAVTGVTTTVDKADYDGLCNPVNLVFTADIRVNKAGTIKYHWKFSDTADSAVVSLKFTEAGTVSVEYELPITKSAGEYTGWAQVYIDDPNHQLFPKASYTLTCTE